MAPAPRPRAGSGRRASNEAKILRRYGDSAAVVIVRGKAAADIEFGNKPRLGVNRDDILPHLKIRGSTSQGVATLLAPISVRSE